MRLPLFSPGWTTGAAASPRAPPPEAPPAASASERPGGEGGKRQGRKREGGEVSRHGGRVRGAWWLKREASNCRVDRWVRGEPRTDGRGGGNFFLSGAAVSDRGPGEKQQVLFRVCPEIPPPPRALTPSASCWANHASRILRGDETVGTGGAGRCRQREGRVITSSGGMMSNKPPFPSSPLPRRATAQHDAPFLLPDGLRDGMVFAVVKVAGAGNVTHLSAQPRSPVRISTGCSATASRDVGRSLGKGFGQAGAVCGGGR